ncbi:hypothetical protein [Nocardia transvalensis]|uniref:hypothetical protein n=1 Tax=Nocardia transvalensis TaxID=37333 RepID=UPI00189524C7|nr:hypothetical protein [Nocardia transvalensis]MBF6328723.1 hypothetical protein [Nocardia transvalensis]
MIADVGAVLGGLGVGSLGTAFVTGLLGRRKQRADAVQVLTKAAADLVEPLRNQLAEVTHAFEEHKQRHRVAAARHTVWDNEVRESLRAVGLEVPPPPPLDAL